MNIRAVLLDLDGTLWRPVPDHDGTHLVRRNAERAHRIAELLGISPAEAAPAVEDFWQAWPSVAGLPDFDLSEPDGPGTLASFLAARGISAGPEAIAACWRAMRIPAAEYPFELFPDTLEVLAHLERERIATAIVTNNFPAELVRPDLDAFGIRPDVLICSADVGYRKPHRMIFSRALQSLGMKPASVFMVGDSFQNDVRGARAFGITAILKTNGRPPSPEEVRGSDHLISGLGELLDLDIWS